MQFDRRWFWQPNDTTGGDGKRAEALARPENAIWFLKKNGFIQRNGEELTDYQECRWKYDNTNEIFLHPWQNSDWCISCSLMFQPYHWHGTNSEKTNLADRVFLDHDISPSCSFFIPLKNQGFLLTNFTRDYPYTPTPPLYTPLTKPFVNYGYVDAWITVGLFNNISNRYSYIYGWAEGNDKNCYVTGDGKMYFRTGDATENWHDNNGHRNGIKYKVDNLGRQTDVKQNICTMIKYPYLNGFLSNLFLITTAPQKGYVRDDSSWNPSPDACGLENKFFSFNGRNFYGIYANVAVELPAN